jgi:hypothetical protein
MKTNKDYLNKFKEWQNHQYDPGHYTGGKVPPMMTNPGKTVRLAWFLIIQAAIFLPASIAAVIYVSTLTKENIIPMLIPFFVFLLWGFCLLSLEYAYSNKVKIK